MKRHAILLMMLGALIGAEPDGCGPCVSKDECPPSADCRAGLVPDRCGCCMVCGRIEGEKCDNKTITNREAHYGSCGENLACLLRDDLEDLDIIETVCVCKKDGAVCGTDGRTYASVCKLKQEAALQPDGDLGVKEWSPCESAPVITSKPENVTASINDDLALSCEVRGYPIPSLIWEFESAATGRKIKLPGDDQMIALQVRGGPESFMVSSWVQILRVRSTDAGVYSCTVVSKKGIVRAEATVQVTKRVKLVSDKKPPTPTPPPPAGSVAKSATQAKSGAKKNSRASRSKESIHSAP